MSTVLITGASGFIGKALASSMAGTHDVICMSRNDPELDLPWIQGDFGSLEDLGQLDDRTIDVVVHLAAVTGRGTERDGIIVNVEGSRGLMRYLREHGCRKFVMASSIAAVGFQSIRFRPLCVPIPDEHPCFDRDGYGFSKFLMEAVTKYAHRQDETIDVIDLRLSTVLLTDNLPDPAPVEPVYEWSLGRITIMALSDAVRVFTMAAEAPHRAGVRIMNAAGPKAWTAVPVAEILRNWWGDDVDLSHFEQAGHEYDSVFDVSRIEQELGFVAQRLPPAAGQAGSKEGQ